MTTKQGIQIIVEKIILAFTEDFFLRRPKKVKPTYLAMNMYWFTNCSWMQQLIAFKQLDRYTV